MVCYLVGTLRRTQMTATVLRLDPKGHHRIVPGAASGRNRLGDILVRRGDLAPGKLLAALALQAHERRPLGEILTVRGWVQPTALSAALAIQAGVADADFGASPPDTHLIDLIGASACLRLGILPWKRAGAVTIVAVSDISRASAQRAEIEAAFGPVRFVIAQKGEIEAQLLATRQGALTRHAELRVPATEAVRGLAGGTRRTVLTLICAVGIAAVLFPIATFGALAAWSVLTLLLTSGLRAAATMVQLRHMGHHRPLFSSHRADLSDGSLPIVSVLVPLFRETAIADHLVRRLARIDYPAAKLDICLVVEEDDTLTRATLARSDLPAWMRQIVVPAGTVRTKPRAMNYALDFCRGTIIGVYDAEDAPAPDQIRRVVDRFRNRPPEVACLQGILDFYNARTNWLSRCFTIDYATWFRIVLPGIARMGLVVPLGGTTLFFRRAALDRLGGWDARNVTEDADLGLRLARHGYRCELIESVTEEEANCHAIPWIRQRSRWLKGYAITWMSHMRAPRRLLRDLGPWRFFGVQVLFLGTLSNFVLAPLVWSFWLLPFGLPHPLSGVLPWWLFVLLGSAFLLTELVNVAAGALAVSTVKHRWLIPWVPTMHAYHPLGAVASWKGLLELVVNPFYWDKTAHGLYGPERLRRSAPPARRRV